MFSALTYGGEGTGTCRWATTRCQALLTISSVRPARLVSALMLLVADLAAVRAALHGLQEELCELREAVQDIEADLSDVEFVYLKGEQLDIVEYCEGECCDCEDCFEL